MPVCRNCGSHVSRDFSRVFSMGEEVHACPSCSNFRKLSRGSAAGKIVETTVGGDRDGDHGNEPVASWVPSR